MKSKLGFSLLEMILVIVAIIAVVGASITDCQAGSVTEPTVFRDRVAFRGSTGPDFDSVNVFSIGGTKVEATAAQLSAAAGGSITNGTVVTNAVLTLSPAAITATSAITRQTFVPPFILSDGTTNAIAIMTNATAAVTVMNGGVVITNVVITLTRHE